MTPFGRKLRELRAARNLTLKEMAGAIGVSAAYLSALEHGQRGAPSWYLLQRIIGYFNIIWDEADELERLARGSNPRVVVDTSGLQPEATEFANRLAAEVRTLDVETFRALMAVLVAREKPANGG
jgi:transcriptional regulator with XRE-family HTH domain